MTVSLTSLQQQIVSVFPLLASDAASAVGKTIASEERLVDIVLRSADLIPLAKSEVVEAIRDLERKHVLIRRAESVERKFTSAVTLPANIAACQRGGAATYGPISADALPDAVTGRSAKDAMQATWMRAGFLKRYVDYLVTIGILAPAAAILDELAVPPVNIGYTLRFYDSAFRDISRTLLAAVRAKPDAASADVRETLLPFTLEAAFFAGGPVEQDLERAVIAAPRHAALRCAAAAVRIAPLCVLTGRRDLLDRYTPLEGLATANAVDLARLFFGKGPTRIVPKPLDYMVGDLQTALVALLAARFAPAPVRLADALRERLEDADTIPADAAYAEFLRGALTPTPEPDDPYDYWRERKPAPPKPRNQTRAAIAWLGRTLGHALSSEPALRTSFPEAPHALAAAEIAEAAGLHFLAAQLGALLAQWPATSERGLALAAKAPPDMPLLWKPAGIARPWDPLLEELEKAVAPLAKAKKPRAAKKTEGSVLVATLTLEPLDFQGSSSLLGGDAFVVNTLALSLVKRRRDGSLSPVEKPSTFRAIRKAFLERSVDLPNEAIEAIEPIFRREVPGFASDAHAANIGSTSREEMLDILLALRGTAGLRIVALNADARNRKLPAIDTIEEPDVDVANITLRTAWDPDGSLRLSAPPLAWSSNHRQVFVRTEPGRFTWHRMTSAVRPLLDLIQLRGDRDSLVIPKGGAEKARELLLGAAAAGLPVEGAITPAGDAADLKTVAGAAHIVARLQLRDGSLSAQLRARPVAKVPDLLFEPGRGRPELAVPSASEPFLLRRDLAGERAVADDVRAALADFAGESEGDCDWRADEPARQLALLEALRAASEADPKRVTLEWRGVAANRLDIRAVDIAELTGAKGADWWLGVEGTFQLDDGSDASLRAVIEALPRRVGGYVPLDGRTWLRLTAGLRKRLEALATAGRVEGDTLRVSPAALPMLEEAFTEAPDGSEAGAFTLRLPAELERLAADFREAMAAEHPVPEGLSARLRPYQREGFEWLARLAACNLGACLADDMGLGKTVQLISLLLERAAGGPSLVVAPASVCGNWCAELARFAPGLHAVRAGDAAALPDALGPGDIVVTSYGLLVSREAQYTDREWNVAVLDEAQAVKNADAKRAQAVKRLRAACRFVATGTPVENRLSDLWSLFDFLNPGLLGTLDSFRRNLLDPSGRPLPALKSLVRPLILRRLKGEVLRDLPEKTEITLDVELGEAERTAYETLREEAVAELQSGGQGRTDGQRRIQILAALTRLRRFCCAPGLVLPGFGTGAKLEALEQLLDDLRANGHRALVFSQFVDVLALVRPILERRGWAFEYLDGATPQAERTRRVEAFQRGDAPFFLISLKAGGTGLNLTAANYVVLLDPWWNPAVEDQAADRAHRIGQRNPVTVYRLVTRGTIEEKVLALHGDKRELSSAVLEGTGDAKVSSADLLALFRRE